MAAIAWRMAGSERLCWSTLCWKKAPPKKPASCGAVLMKKNSSAGGSIRSSTAGAGANGLGRRDACLGVA